MTRHHDPDQLCYYPYCSRGDKCVCDCPTPENTSRAALLLRRWRADAVSDLYAHHLRRRRLRDATLAFVVLFLLALTLWGRR